MFFITNNNNYYYYVFMLPIKLFVCSYRIATRKRMGWRRYYAVKCIYRKLKNNNGTIFGFYLVCFVYLHMALAIWEQRKVIFTSPYWFFCYSTRGVFFLNVYIFFKRQIYWVSLSFVQCRDFLFHNLLRLEIIIVFIFLRWNSIYSMFSVSFIML